MPVWAGEIEEPELALYYSLCEHLDRSEDDPYLRYNSWRDELASLVSALEHRPLR